MRARAIFRSHLLHSLMWAMMTLTTTTITHPTHATAATLEINASNAGPIESTGRDLVFDLSAVNGEIKAAFLQLQLNYSRAAELGFVLRDVSGTVELPLATPILAGASVFSGTYTFSDRGKTSLTQAVSLDASVVPNAMEFAPVQAGFNGGFWINHLARYLEFDLGDAATEVTLRINRVSGAGGGGSGSIGSAKLILEIDARDRLFASGMDEVDLPIPRGFRPPLDVIVNGGVESRFSPLSLIRFDSGSMFWSLQYLQNPQPSFSDIGFGSTNDTQVYAGRFGGRSRMNIGFWDANTGTLNFSTGAGARTLALDGEWQTTSHLVMPGDYDGDGITDLAVAYLDGVLGWVARIRYSSSDITRDHLIDPRALFPANFSSGSIGIGPGQDADRDGRDEIFLYARLSNASPNMAMVQLVPNPNSNTLEAGFAGPQWGVDGAQMILGDWSNSSAGNQLGLMVVQKTATEIQWYRFPDPTPVIFGLPSIDTPVSIDFDGDGLNDIALYRAVENRWYVIKSSNGENVTFDFGSNDAVPLGLLQGTIAPLQF